MITFGFLAYFASENTVLIGLQMSGIISLLTFAIIQSHYTWYNLSPQGKSTTAVTFAFLGHTAEAAVYSYVGISLYSTIPGWWSFGWISIQLVIIILGRIVAVIGTFYLFRLCFRKKTISFNELIFITYGGMIRGAIAFALVLKIPHTCLPPLSPKDCFSLPNYEVAKSTTLVIVMVTTLLFGTFMKVFQIWLLGPPPTKKEQHETQLDVLSRFHSIYEEIKHPNEEESEEEEQTQPVKKSLKLSIKQSMLR